MKLLFLDTETTGTEWVKHGVIQIAGIVDIDGEVKKEFNFKCRPFKGQLLDPKAMELHKLTREELATWPDPKEAYQELLKVLDGFVDRYSKEDKFYMVGQNTKFDYDFMNKFFKLNQNFYFYGYVFYHLIDLIQMSCLFRVAGIVNVPNMKLETMAKYFGIPLEAHKAENDIKATRALFYKYLEMVKGLPKVVAAAS